MAYKHHSSEQINKAIDLLDRSEPYWAYMALDQKCPYCGEFLECDIDIVFCNTPGCPGFSHFTYADKIPEGEA